MAPFGPGHTALNGIRCSDHPEGATMRRIRLLAAVGVLVVAAAARGGDDSDQADPAPTSPRLTDRGRTPPIRPTP